MSSVQDEVFLENEGDNWFRRNRGALHGARSTDWPVELIGMLGDLSRIQSVAELGCSTGYRLDELRRRMPKVVRWAGIDASAEAVAEGMERCNGVELAQGLLSGIPLEGEFDLVIVNFVLHWVDRRTLVRSLAEIDRVVADGGLLVLGDFLPGYPQRRAYHHLPDAGVFTYKQDYARTFEALGVYREVARVTYDHDLHSDTVGCAPGGTSAFCSVLRKSFNDYYPVDDS
ncbi:MAG: class I SAM-dependent methyltransferase [Coriobacteriia bacterium]